jgi:hypothetical protein
VFATLLMKGGVLVIAPIVDLVVRSKKRKIYWPSWTAAGLSLLALVISFVERANVAVTFACVVDVVIYLVAFFFKLVFMSRWAKTTNVAEKRRFMVEGQTATAAVLLGLIVVMAFIGRFMGGDGPAGQVWRGVSLLPAMGFVDVPLAIGAVSAVGGILATLIILDRRENTFCIALAQSTSIVAGTIATSLLAFFYDQPAPGVGRLIGVCIMLAAIFFLAYHGVVEKKSLRVD